MDGFYRQWIYIYAWDLHTMTLPKPTCICWQTRQTIALVLYSLALNIYFMVNDIISPTIHKLLQRCFHGLNILFFAGVSHSDEELYLFPDRQVFFGFMRTLPTKEELQVRKAMIEMWTNFARTGWVRSWKIMYFYCNFLIRNFVSAIRTQFPVICRNGIKLESFHSIIIDLATWTSKVNRCLAWKMACLKIGQNFGEISDCIQRKNIQQMTNSTNF